MWIDLQGLDDADERQRGRLAAALPPAVYRLLVEPDPAWEAPLDGSSLPEVPLPSAQEYDLRTLDRSLFDSLDETGAGDAAKVDGPARRRLVDHFQNTLGRAQRRLRHRQIGTAAAEGRGDASGQRPVERLRPLDLSGKVIMCHR